MDGYETDGSSALDPVFNDDSSLDNQWSADAAGTGLRAIRGGGQGGPASDRSNFSVIRGGKSAARNAEARAAGRAAENGASGDVAGQNAKDLEENSPFVNNVSGKESEDKKKKRRRRRFMRTIGPSGFLISLIGMIVALVAGSQWLFPFALVANGLEQFNAPLQTIMNRRGNILMKKQLGGLNKSYTRGGIFSSEKFKVSKSMQKKFAKNSITYVDDADGVRLLYFVDEDTGQRMAIAANPEDAGRIPSTISIPEFDTNGNPTGNYKSVGVDWRGDLTSAMDSSDNFFKAQNRSTLTIKGKVAGWWDSLSEGFHHKISNTRAKFNGLSQTADAEEVEAAARNGTLGTDMDDANPLGLEEEKSGIEDIEEVEVPVEENGKPVYDENGNPVTKTEQVPVIDTDPVDPAVEGNDGNLSARPGADVGDMRVHAVDTLNARARKLMLSTEKESKGASIVCMVLRTFGSISLAITGLQIVQILNYITGFVNAIDMAKSGDGGNAMNKYMKGWNTTGETRNIRNEVIEGKERSNAITAAPTYAMFGGAPVSPNDESAQMFNVEYATTNAFTGETAEKLMGEDAAAAEKLGEDGTFSSGLMELLGTTAITASTSLAAYQACNMIRLGTNALQIAVHIFDIVGGFLTSGVSYALTALRKAVEGIVESAKYWVAMAMVGILISAVIPLLAQWLTLDLLRIADLPGEYASYANNSGWNIYGGRQMQQSSGTPGNREQVATQYRQAQEVLAEEARYDRLTHSPFDITNKNTFLGSLAYAAIPIATTMNHSSLFSTVSQVANTVGSSVTALFPTVKAAGDATWFTLSANDECPALSTLGLVGDAYCNPYFVSDYSTIDMDPGEVYGILCEEGNFEVESCEDAAPETEGEEEQEFAYNPPIKSGSTYADWIVSCAMRESPFGYIDDRVTKYVSVDTGNTALNSIVNSGISAIPLVGELIDVKEAYDNMENADWSTGANCVSGEYKVYSRYSEDQRLIEAMGMVEESSTTAFMREYYEKNPLDSSLEGTIARYTGMSLAQVNETLDVAAYVYYIANYDPDERRQLAVDILDRVDKPLVFEGDDNLPVQEYIILPELNKFSDLRSRTQIA